MESSGLFQAWPPTPSSRRLAVGAGCLCWVGLLCGGVAVVAVVSILELWWRGEGCRTLGGGVQVTRGPGEAATLAPYRGAGGCKSESFTCCNCMFGPWLLTSHIKDGNTTGTAGLTPASESR